MANKRGIPAVEWREISCRPTRIVGPEVALANADREQLERDLDRIYPGLSRAHYDKQLRAIRQLREDIAATRIEVATNIERLRVEQERS